MNELRGCLQNSLGYTGSVKNGQQSLFQQLKQTCSYSLKILGNLLNSKQFHSFFLYIYFFIFFMGFFCLLTFNQRSLLRDQECSRGYIHTIAKLQAASLRSKTNLAFCSGFPMMVSAFQASHQNIILRVLISEIQKSVSLTELKKIGLKILLDI